MKYIVKHIPQHLNVFSQPRSGEVKNTGKVINEGQAFSGQRLTISIGTLGENRKREVIQLSGNKYVPFVEGKVIPTEGALNEYTFPVGKTKARAFKIVNGKITFTDKRYSEGDEITGTPEKVTYLTHVLPKQPAQQKSGEAVKLADGSYLWTKHLEPTKGMSSAEGAKITSAKTTPVPPSMLKISMMVLPQLGGIGAGLYYAKTKVGKPIDYVGYAILGSAVGHSLVQPFLKTTIEVKGKSIDIPFGVKVLPTIGFLGGVGIAMSGKKKFWAHVGYGLLGTLITSMIAVPIVTSLKPVAEEKPKTTK